MPFEFNDIEHAKKTMRVCHKVFEENLDELDCGLGMICMVRPNVSEKARLWNGAIDWLIKNDPSCPKGLVDEKIDLRG